MKPAPPASRGWIPVVGGPKDGESWELEALERLEEDAPTCILVPEAITLERLESVQDLERVSELITRLEERLIIRRRLLVRWGVPLGPGEAEEVLELNLELQRARERWDRIMGQTPRVRFHEYRLAITDLRPGRRGWAYVYAGLEGVDNSGEKGG